MKIKTIYTPSDQDGADINFSGVYTLADLAKLGSDLVKAGVTANDGLEFRVNASGVLNVVVEKTL